ncbi:hypothetical protein [Arthrobacter sp. ISL-5]|uniref:hypothetical protein n=1 Tax=Arthrobacter sp. ISL-5 TaxID=2819111 RepID=UPI001BEB95C4|nr:hypothetical protein [Arthrobacter sp. ISL-5]MBT2552808.1 hypothetical protein [Arthrobacter sp. ISL-5]
MKTGISAAIRRFIEQHIVADDPYPERSWLDRQDMPCTYRRTNTTADRQRGTGRANGVRPAS